MFFLTISSMAYYDSLPFYNLNDQNFYIFLNENPYNIQNEVIALDHLDNLCFNPFTFNDDDHLSDTDPDNFILRSLGYNNLSCKYHFPNSMSNDFHNLPSKTFSLICHNIGSIPSHLDEFIDQCLTPLCHNFDVIGLCESKLTNDIEQLYTIPNYTLFSNNQTRHSGGVALYIKKCYNSIARSDLTIKEEYIETVFVEICSPNSGNIIVGIHFAILCQEAA